MEIPALNSYDFVRPSTRALWHLETSGADSSGYGNTLMPWGTVTYPVGRFGKCAKIDNGFLRTSSLPSSVLLDNMSIFLWAKSTASFYQSILSVEYYQGMALWGYQVGIIDSKLFFMESSWEELHAPQHVGNSIIISDGKWHWLAITRGDTYVSLYVDGKMDYRGTKDSLSYTYGGLEYATVGAWWCSYCGDFHDYFFGNVDEVHVMDGELSYSTIRRMYAFQRGWI